MRVAGGSLASFIAVGLYPYWTHASKVKVDGYRSFCACIILNSFNKTALTIPAQELWQNLTDTIDSSDQSECYSWNHYPDSTISVFSDRFGKPTSDILKSAGVFAHDVYAYCGPPEIGEVSKRSHHNLTHSNTHRNSPSPISPPPPRDFCFHG